VVELDGIPVSVIGHHQLAIDDDEGQRASRRFVLTVAPGENRRLELSGPRYHGVRWVSREECDEVMVVRMHVEPLPAELELTCPEKGMTLECQDCPGPAGERIYLAEHFPAIEVDAFDTAVWVLFRAPGFQRELKRLILHPGPNPRHIELRRL
jgi:hypothetical protein